MKAINKNPTKLGGNVMTANNEANEMEVTDKSEETKNQGPRIIKMTFIWLLIHSGIMLAISLLAAFHDVMLWGNFILVGAYIVLAFLLRLKSFVLWLITVIVLGLPTLGGIIRMIIQRGGDIIPIITAIIAFIYLLNCYGAIRHPESSEAAVKKS